MCVDGALDLLKRHCERAFQGRRRSPSRCNSAFSCRYFTDVAPLEEERMRDGSSVLLLQGDILAAGHFRRAMLDVGVR